MATIKEEIYQRMAQEQAQAPAPVAQIEMTEQEQNEIAGPAFEFTDDMPASETIYRQFIKNPDDEPIIDEKKAEKARKLAAFSDFASLIAGGIAAAGGGNVAKMDNTATEQYNNTYSKMYDYYKQSKDRYNTGLASAVMQDSRYRSQMEYNRQNRIQQYNQNKALRQQNYDSQVNLLKEKQKQEDEQLKTRTQATKDLYDYKLQHEKEMARIKQNNAIVLKKTQGAGTKSSGATKTGKKEPFTGGVTGGAVGR